MAVSKTTQEVQLEHPYKVPGALLVIVSLVFIAFDIGYLETCGNGTGVCLDWTSHKVGTAALVGFFVLFVIGVVLILYTGASSTMTTQTTRVPPATPAAPAAVTVVTPAAPPPPSGTTVTVTPPRQSA
ncbi:MAG TPA: hypothetical protein VGP88_02110 [Thermoplasmata archaeon]|jgi:hypothetical protein|nr:hypothetical protein [Thermoplasmata archaeon]